MNCKRTDSSEPEKSKRNHMTSTPRSGESDEKGNGGRWTMRLGRRKGAGRTGDMYVSPGDGQERHKEAQTDERRAHPGRGDVVAQR